jgi:RNA polymerase sigma factor (sigma-70 family)
VFTSDPLAHPEALIRRVYGYVAYRIGDGCDAEDVTSETFERALRYRGSYDPAKGTAINWLIGIARSVIATRGRPAEIPVAEIPDEAEEADDLVERLVLSAAVAALQESDRELIALRYGADMKVKHMAALLGMRTNSVEVALHRARRRLASALDGSAAHDEHDAGDEEPQPDDPQGADRGALEPEEAEVVERGGERELARDEYGDHSRRAQRPHRRKRDRHVRGPEEAAGDVVPGDGVLAEAPEAVGGDEGGGDEDGRADREGDGSRLDTADVAAARSVDGRLRGQPRAGGKGKGDGGAAVHAATLAPGPDERRKPS